MKYLLSALLTLAGASFAFGNPDACADAATCPVTGAKGMAATCPASCCDSGSSALITSYEEVATALASDDFDAAKSAAENLTCHAECLEDTTLQANIDKFTTAASIDDARTVFKAISAAIIEHAGDSADYVIMTCPMAKADWIQSDEDVANPYFGSKMLKCGAVKKTVTAKL